MLSTAACRVRRRQRGQELGARSSGLGRGLMCLSCYETSAVPFAPGVVAKEPSGPDHTTVPGRGFACHFNEPHVPETVNYGLDGHVASLQALRRSARSMRRCAS